MILIELRPKIQYPVLLVIHPVSNTKDKYLITLLLYDNQLLFLKCHTKCAKQKVYITLPGHARTQRAAVEQ